MYACMHVCIYIYTHMLSQQLRGWLLQYGCGSKIGCQRTHKRLLNYWTWTFLEFGDILSISHVHCIEHIQHTCMNPMNDMSCKKVSMIYVACVSIFAALCSAGSLMLMSNLMIIGTVVIRLMIPDTPKSLRKAAWTTRRLAPQRWGYPQDTTQKSSA